MNKGVLFAAIVILIGLLLLLKSIFNWNISIFRVIVGIVVIVVGVSLLTGGFHTSAGWSTPFVITSNVGENNTIFGSRNYEVKTPGKYNVIFGSAIIDLQSVEYQPGEVVEVDVVFGQALIRLKKDMPVNIQSSAAFAELRHPDSVETVWLGEQRTVQGQGADVLVLKVNCVFGSTRIVQMP